MELRQAIAQEEDLCARERITAPGAVQPHGWLLAFERSSLILRGYSGTIEQIFASAPDQPLSAARLPAPLQACLLRLSAQQDSSCWLPVILPGQTMLQPVHCFTSGPLVCCEGEILPALPPDSQEVAEEYSSVMTLQEQLSRETQLAGLCQKMADAIRQLTGFDRVMVYRFDPNGDGEVIGESLVSDWHQSFKGMRFPASDIPPQARTLYRRTLARWLPTAFYQPVPLIQLGIDEIDLSSSRYRSVSPVHLLYQRNIGVDGAMSLSVLRQGKLWGMIIGHHRRPHRVPLPRQQQAELLTASFTVTLDALLCKQDADEIVRESQRHQALLAKLAAAEDYQSALLDGEPSILTLLPGCTGAAVVWSDERGRHVRSIGTVPDRPDLIRIADLLRVLRQGNIYATDRLGLEFPAFTSVQTIASGVLACCFEDSLGTTLLLLRPEQVQTVIWAGKPDKLQGSDGNPSLPRRSFNRWLERRRGAAIPWQSWELQIVDSLCATVNTVILRQNRRIRDLMNAHIALRQQEARTRLLLETVEDGIYGVDLLGNVTFVNPAICRITGWAAESLMGQNIHDLIHHTTGAGRPHARQDCLVYKAMKQGVVYHEPRDMLWRQDGSTFPAELIAAPIMTESGCLGAVVVARDISRQLRHEEDLQRSNEELEQFSYVVSHDMREPLRMISSYMMLLERRLCGVLDDLSKDYLNYARNGAVRLDQMIRDLLDYSRIGKGDDLFAPVDLGPVMDEALRNLSACCAEENAVIILPDSCPVVPGRRSELVRLFQNLMANALKYRDPDRLPRIRISLRRSDGAWEVAVEDNGRGIPLQHTERIFEIFQRLDGHDQVHGSGIGLAACRKIVSHHGGQIWVRSEPGTGSTFLFTLSDRSGMGRDGAE